MSGRVRIGIDLGGTKIEGIALDRSDEVARLLVDTPRDDYPATVEAVAALVETLEERAGVGASVGLELPVATAVDDSMKRAMAMGSLADQVA